MERTSTPSPVLTKNEVETGVEVVEERPKNYRFVPIATKIPFLKKWGIWTVEGQRISPVPYEERVDKRAYQQFLIYFAANFNVLGFSTGSSGPAFFALSLRDASLAILVACAVGCLFPALFAIYGPKLGMRGMVQARFSWGYWGATIPSLLNVISMQGYLILNSIIGGYTLASVSSKLDATSGIVIIGIISLVVTFFGYRVLHWFETLCWIPNLVAFTIMLGLGGKHLREVDPTFPPTPSASTVISFGSVIGAWNISWCTLTPDYGVYHDAKASSLKTFILTYLGFFLSTSISNILGASFTSAAAVVPAWNSGFSGKDGIGGLVAAILAPVGGFGKFLIVLMAISTVSSCAPAMYTFSTSLMAVTPAFARVPQYVPALISTGILIPVGIIGAKRFYDTLVNILSIVGYWVAPFAAIVLTEHYLFRKNDFASYNIDTWDQPRSLPSSFPAIFAFLGSVGVIVISMSQVWYSGPIAVAGTGDIGMILGFLVASALYAGLRGGERWLARRSGKRSPPAATR